MAAPADPLSTHWTLRALATHSAYAAPGVRKYKPVDRKVRPVPTYMPNPSAQVFQPVLIPTPDILPHHPPPRSLIVPTTRLTKERLEQVLATVPEGFLSSEELDLLCFVLYKREAALAFDHSERGVFSRLYYPDYEIPIIEHTPWVQEPIRIPKAIEPEVRALLNEQRLAGKYEDSCASYRSRVFAVLKSMNKLRLVHDLQEMNKHVVRDAALPPRADDFAESFVGHAVYMLADLYSGYDAVMLAECSRDLTTFSCLDRTQRLTVLPQGATNSVVEFQRRMSHAIRDEIPHTADVFIDDVGLKGPTSTYQDEPLPDNPGIRRFVFEYATDMDRLFARFIAAGVTASGTKLVLATPRIQIVGSVVSLEGWHLAHGIVSKVLKWPTPESVTDIRGFLGVAGVGRRWIKSFALIAKPLTVLCRKTDDIFTWTEEAQVAMDKLKKRITSAPVLKKLDYDLAKEIIPSPPGPLRTSDHGLVIVAVDSSIYGSGWVLYQTFETDRHPVLFGSCTFNRVESKYSQPKVELYGVFRALKELRHRVWGIHVSLEVDAKFLEKMIKEPDLPNAPMTRWVSYINLFDFRFKHVPATKGVAQDGLSRRRQSIEDSEEDDAEKYLDEFFGLSATAYNSGASRADLSRLALFTACRYDEMATRTGGWVDRYDQQRYADDPAFAMTTPGIREERLGDAIQEWEERHVGVQPFRYPWDANIRYNHWIRRQHTRGWDYPCAYDGLDPQSQGLIDATQEFLPNLGSPFSCGAALLRNLDDVTYIGREFFERRVGREQAEYFLLGDELIVLPFTEYRAQRIATPLRAKDELDHIEMLVGYARRTDRYHRGDTSHEIRNDGYKSYEDIPPPPDTSEGRQSISCIGHAHRRPDADSAVEWRNLEQFLRYGELPPSHANDDCVRRKFENLAKSYIVRDARLWKLSGYNQPRLVILDKERRKSLVAECHLVCGHRGRDATYIALKDRYFWPNMYDDVAWHVRSCNVCQFRSKVRPAEPLNITLSPSVFRRIAFDTIYMPRGTGGLKFLLHATDTTSKWEESRGARKNDSKTWEKFILELICRFGCFLVAVCDGGPEFKAAVRRLFEKYGITIILSSPYHPEGNGVAERSGQTLKNTLLKCCGDKPERWPEYLQPALWSMRTTVTRATGFTPYFLTYGQDSTFPFDISDRTWFVLDWDSVKTHEDLLVVRTQQLARRERDIGTAVEHLERSRRRAAADRDLQHSRSMRTSPLKPGTRILVHETWQDAQHGHKGARRWSGPFVIHSRNPSGSYTIRELDGAILKESVAASRVKLFYVRDDYQTMSANADFDDATTTAALLARPSSWWGHGHSMGTHVEAHCLADAIVKVDDNGVERYDVYWNEGTGISHSDGVGVRHRTNIKEILDHSADIAPWTPADHRDTFRDSRYDPIALPLRYDDEEVPSDSGRLVLRTRL